MRFYEFKTIQPIKPLTQQQARINSLKQQKERVGKLLKAERDRQKKQKATQLIQQTNKKLSNI
jgi:ABC-type bacteriocin/lantibiotic exporter with double-glycine peptidase domain